MRILWPLHVHVSVLFVLLMLAVGGALGWLGYDTALRIAETNVDAMVERIGRETVLDVDRLMAPAALAVDALAFDPITAAGTHDARMERLPALTRALRSAPAASALYVGYPNGDFFLVRRFVSEAERTDVNAPSGASLLVQSIERDAGAGLGAVGRYLFLDEDLNVVRADDRPEYPDAYDPRSRPWYDAAHETGERIRTEPYAFFTTGAAGVTIAAPAPADGASPAGPGPVLGVDLTLNDLRSGLEDRTITPGTHLALADPRGSVVAHAGPEPGPPAPAGDSAVADSEPTVVVPNGVPSTPAPLGDEPPWRADRSEPTDAPVTLPILETLGVPVLAAVADDAVARVTGASDAARTFATRVAGRDWRVGVRRIADRSGETWTLLVAIPSNELLAEAHRLRNAAAWTTLGVLALAALATWFVARSIAFPLQRLARDADAIRRFEFHHEVQVRTRVLEVDRLADAMAETKTTIRRFLEVTAAVANETDFDRLQRRLLNEMVRASDASGGVLLLEKDGRLAASLAQDADGDGWPVRRARVNPCDPADAGLLIADAVREGIPLHGGVDQLNLEALGLDPSVANGAPAVLAVPLANRDGVMVGMLLLFRERPVGEAQVAFLTALSASSTTSVETRRLIDEQKELFESLVRMIAGAIDAKSPYTGGHCARVPELAKLLARAACDANEGPYADFELSERQWEALHVAAWLHDAGKVTTPEFVVDKATKLETVHDRLHEVRMRFEVAKREAQLRALRRRFAGDDPDAVDTDLNRTLRELDDDFAFVARCNDGEATMGDDDVARLHRIAGRTWTRTLSDRIGVSRAEAQRRARTPEPDLPVEEPLLADAPWHRIEHCPNDPVVDRERLGITMDPPELLYDLGELHALTVARGTLTEEERFKIQEHVVQTIAMLERLPFPRHLREVPEIAGGHHERVDGRGYPRGLTGEQMSPLARMMAVADVFEALTAGDRPYKPAKRLSQAVAILAAMAREGHVDPELFRLFLRSGAYRTYAERHLRPDQIDEVDVEAVLAGAR